MNASQLSKLLLENKPLSQEDEVSLREIEETYPFFALPKILVTRHYKMTGSYKFENKLKDTALRVLNRQQLYTILTAESISEPIQEIDTTLVETEIESPIPVVESELVEEAKESITALQELPSVERPMESKDETLAPISPVEPIKQVEIAEEPTSFTAWLNQVSPGHDEFELQPIESHVEEVQLGATEMLFEADHEIESPTEEIKPKKDIEDILNRFIELNPSISKPKAEFFNPVKIAQESLEEDENLVTETLVKIYLKQKNFKKAIRALEKLSLIYPLKSNFFAAQIREIKETNHIH